MKEPMRGERRDGAAGGESNRAWHAAQPSRVRAWQGHRALRSHGRGGMEGVYRLVIPRSRGLDAGGGDQQTAGNQGRAARILESIGHPAKRSFASMASSPGCATDGAGDG